MPVIANKLSTALQLKVKTGTDPNGNDTFANQSYRRVKASVTDSDIFEVAQTIGALESTPVVSVIKAVDFELVNQA